MIATWNVPGSSDFECVRVKNRAEASAWWVRMEAGKTAARAWNTSLLTEREARTVRNADGSRVYGDDVLSLADWISRDDRATASEKEWFKGVREQAEQDNAAKRKGAR